MKHYTGPRVEKDPFGNGVDTKTHRINQVMSTTPQTLQQIALQCKDVDLGHIRNHMTSLIKKGFAKENGTSNWSLTESASVKFRANDKMLVRVELLRAEDADGAEPQNQDAYNREDGDYRETVTREIRARRGQPQFRNALMDQYGSRCVVTQCGIVAILEAAHINPYRGDNDNHPTNGLLLRADIHTLFDLDLLGVEPEQLYVEMHPDIIGEYGHLAGKPLICPKGVRPSKKALESRYKLFCQRRKDASFF